MAWTFCIFLPSCVKSMPLTANLNEIERTVPLVRGNEPRSKDTNVFSSQGHVTAESLINYTQKYKTQDPIYSKKKHRKWTEFLSCCFFLLCFNYLMPTARAPWDSQLLRGGSHF